MTYSEIAKEQNMTIARVKAINILEYLLDLFKKEPKGEAWYQLEDKLTEIIRAK